MADDSSPEPSQSVPPLTRQWCDDTLKRAIAAAEDAGLSAYRIEIGPDGTIAIVVGDQRPEPVKP